MGYADGARFFADDVFSSGRGAQNPLLAQTGRQRNIDRVDVLSGKEFFVAAERLGDLGKGELLLALSHELLGAGQLAAGHGAHPAVAAVQNRVPILPRNFGRTQNSPANHWILDFLVFSWPQA